MGLGYRDNLTYTCCEVVGSRFCHYEDSVVSCMEFAMAFFYPKLKILLHIILIILFYKLETF